MQKYTVKHCSPPYSVVLQSLHMVEIYFPQKNWENVRKDWKTVCPGRDDTMEKSH